MNIHRKTNVDKRHRAVRLLALVTLALACVTATWADPASDWVELADRALDGQSLPPPLRAQRELSAPALTALAIFEAVNAVDRRYQSYLKLPRTPAAASEDAAAAAAGHGVLSALYPERRPALDDALALALSHVALGPERDLGLATGASAARAALARSMFDGPMPDPDRPAGEIGRFVNPQPSIIAPWMLQAKFFFLTSIEEVMPPAPPTLTDKRYGQDVEETRKLGGTNAAPEALRRARFLAGFSLDPVMQRAMSTQSRLVDKARLLALLHMAQHDANAMIVIAKVRYKTWRPINAIRNADRDQNALTKHDPAWSPSMPTPNHPEYPCGHCVVSSLAASLLMTYQPDGPIEVATDSSVLHVAMVFQDWNAFLDAASLARIQGGMHFRFSNEAGQAMGKRIAALAQHRFAPLIEAP